MYVNAFFFFFKFCCLEVDYCYDQLITVDDCNVVVSAIIYSMWDFFLLIIFLGVRLF